jgi:hypothetical protein
MVEKRRWYAVKFPVTVSGENIVTVVEAALALATLPLQLVKMYPPLAVAPMVTTEPEL